jgi:uncharacterized protein
MKGAPVRAAPVAAGQAVQQEFSAALEALVTDLRKDRSILAAILCGSLSHDAVWTKSDIDLVLVTTDDRKPETPSVSLYADGVNVHAMLLARAEFRKIVEGTMRNSFMHSFLTKGRLLYTEDPTIARLCETLRDLGSRDRQVQLLHAGTHALCTLYKAHKWFITRGDLDYAALWLLYTATPLAQIEVMSAGLLVDREVIPQALALNPPFFKIVYTDLLNGPKTKESVQRALDTVDDYVARRTVPLFGLVLDHLREVGEVRSCREIDDHFRRHFDVCDVTAACEYLADCGLLGKASAPVRLTKRSSADVQELAFYYIAHPAGDD